MNKVTAAQVAARTGRESELPRRQDGKSLHAHLIHHYFYIHYLAPTIKNKMAPWQDRRVSDSAGTLTIVVAGALAAVTSVALLSNVRERQRTRSDFRHSKELYIPSRREKYWCYCTVLTIS